MENNNIIIRNNVNITFDTEITCEEPYDAWAGIEIEEEELIPFKE